MNLTKVSEDLPLIIAKNPQWEEINKKLLVIADNLEYPNSYKSNVQAKMSEWYITSSESQDITFWIEDVLSKVLETKVGILHSFRNNGYTLRVLDLWMARYGVGEYTKSHSHSSSVWSWVYFIKCPKGSSPLVFTTSNVEIEAEEGKVVLFPGNLNHHVPDNKCEDRVVMSANCIFLPENVHLSLGVDKPQTLRYT